MNPFSLPRLMLYAFLLGWVLFVLASQVGWLVVGILLLTAFLGWRVIRSMPT